VKLARTLALLAIAAAANAQTAPVVPAGEWQRVGAKEAGFSDAKLDVVRAWLKTQKTTGLVVVSDGRVVLEHGDVAQISKVASVRKSILAMLYGRYVESGEIDLERTVVDAGRDIYEALETDLAKPLGFQDFSRARQKKHDMTPASRFPEYAMYLSARDMARIGLLMLRGAVTGPYQGAYTAMGAYGQYITVLPVLDLVVAPQVAFDEAEERAGKAIGAVAPWEYDALLAMILASIETEAQEP
jgi:CubicO group peptidase (beta-lactamase class C family)